MLHGLSVVMIDDKFVGSVYARSLGQAMMDRGLKPLKWLKSVNELQGAGARLLGEGKLIDAAYTSAIVGTIMTSTFHDPSHVVALRAAPSLFHRAVYRLRFLSELDVGQALLRLASSDAWETALTAANTAVDLAEDDDTVGMIWDRKGKPALYCPQNDALWYSDHERAQARFQRGSLMTALGAHGLACSDLEVARSLRPGHGPIEEAFIEAKSSQRHD